MNEKMTSSTPTVDLIVEAPASRIRILGPLAVSAIAGTLAVIVANECHRVTLVKGVNAPYLPSLLYGIASWFWWAAFAFLVWGAARRWPVVLAFKWKSVSMHAIVACLTGFAHLFLLQHIIWWNSVFWPSWGAVIGSYFVASLWRYGVEIVIYASIYGLAGFLFVQSRAQVTAMQRMALERQLTQAQLKALQMQMEPHFLFNTLNAITSLVAQGRNQEAMTTLAHLNTILRMTLQRKAPEKVPFAEELRVIESYLAIQQVRFAGRLEVKIDTTPDALDGLVPSFLLQPIVENAIQHGIAPRASGGLVETHVKRVGNTLWMQVRDNGCGPGRSSETEGHGIGMRNTRERLAYFYPGTHEFHAAAPADGGYQVTIQIPYERATV